MVEHFFESEKILVDFFWTVKKIGRKKLVDFFDRKQNHRNQSFSMKKNQPRHALAEHKDEKKSAFLPAGGSSNGLFEAETTFSVGVAIRAMQSAWMQR